MAPVTMEWYEFEDALGEHPDLELPIRVIDTGFTSEEYDPFSDEEPLECSIDHVEICESCQ